MANINPASLDVLKKTLGMVPGDPNVAYSSNILENDPSLTLDTPKTAYEAQANERMKQLLGLGPSPLIAEQNKEADAYSQAVNTARMANNPEISAEADKAQAEKLALAHAQPGGLETEQAKAAAAQKESQAVRDFQAQVMGSGGAAPATGGVTFKPNFNAKGEMSLTGEMPPKLTNAEQAQLDAAKSMSDLGQPLLQQFEAKYPGISADPSKYGSPISDTLTEKLGKGIYSFGGMTNDDAIFQKTAAIQAWGMRQLAQGRINKSMMDIINAHLPQPGYSPGANYDRLNRLLTEVMPALVGGIGTSKADVQQTYSGQDPWSTPPTADELAGAR